MKKFYLYLKNKDLKFVKKDDLEIYFNEFKGLWNLDKEFDSVLNALSKTNMTYLIDGWWALSKEDPLILTSKLLTYLKIPNYYGLETAKYLNKITWQTPSKFLLLNTEFNKIRTINKTKIQFIKFPKELFIESTLIEDRLKYSDVEKTALDLIFKYGKLSVVPKDFDKINLYLGLYVKFPEVKAILINSLNPEYICKIR
jgi:hypothetical protein